MSVFQWGRNITFYKVSVPAVDYQQEDTQLLHCYLQISFWTGVYNLIP